ncbi:unnamed protein product [Camellia sinensis]
MGKREKNLKAAKYHIEEEENEELQSKSAKSQIVLNSSSDDEEANEDLSLKIVEKAMLRACSSGQRNDSESKVDHSLLPLQKDEVVVTDVKSKRKSRKEKKSKKVKKQEETVVVAKDEEEAETIKAIEINELAETNPVEKPDNIVLRKLLRGPRYFDPPDSGWGMCYNCGEEGHKTVNCTSARRRKPCFVCGSLEHNAKQCTKGKDCFICKKGGHRAKDCPEKYKGGFQNSKICLKCGESGHDMFSCKKNYSLDDLKEIQCYICKNFGHLCCADFTDTGPRELSCYRCGLLGHSGLECTRPRGETTSVAMESFGSCFKCGEEGHFARECSSSTKVRKRNLDFSTPTQKFSKDNRDYVRVGSVPSDPAKAHKRRKGQCEGEFTTPSNSKWRGGWITEDPGDLPRGKAKVHGWVSPATPTNMRNKSYTSITGGHSSSSYSSRKTQKFQCEGEFTMPSNSKWRGGWITEDPGDLPCGKAKVHGWVSPATPTNMRNKSYTSITGGHSSSSYSSRKTEKFHFGASASNGSSKFNQHRYSASRFGNSSSDGMRRNYDW